MKLSSSQDEASPNHKCMVPGAVRASGTCTPIRAKVSKRRSNAFGAKDAGLGFQKTPMVDTLQPFQGYKLQSVVQSTSCIMSIYVI